MCVIIKKPAGRIITKREFKAFWYANPDGFGASILDPDTRDIRTFKTLDMREAWRICKDIGTLEAVLHFRIATLGAVSKDLCHPFPLDPQSVLFHNGHLQQYADLARQHNTSDSEILAAFGPDSAMLLKLSDSGQRFATHSPAGIVLYGDFRPWQGLLCSNLHFVPAKRRHRYSGNRSRSYSYCRESQGIADWLAYHDPDLYQDVPF